MGRPVRGEGPGPSQLAAARRSGTAGLGTPGRVAGSVSLLPPTFPSPDGPGWPMPVTLADSQALARLPPPQLRLPTGACRPPRLLSTHGALGAVRDARRGSLHFNTLNGPVTVPTLFPGGSAREGGPLGRRGRGPAQACRPDSVLAALCPLLPRQDTCGPHAGGLWGGR